MLVLSTLVLPFVFTLIRPVPYYLQEIIGHEYLPATLTPITISTKADNIQFTTKIGFNLPAPVYAELERSMTNKVILYHINKEATSLKRLYYYSENCQGILKLTEVKEEATVFFIGYDVDSLHYGGQYFHLYCLRDACKTSNVTSNTSGERWIRATMNATELNRQKFQLELVLGPHSAMNNNTWNAVGNAYPVLGKISPYYMQNILNGKEEETNCN